MAVGISKQTQEAAQQWLQVDTEESSRAAIHSLVAEDNERKLQELLGKRLEFGAFAHAYCCGLLAQGTACAALFSWRLHSSHRSCMYAERNVLQSGHTPNVCA